MEEQEHATATISGIDVNVDELLDDPELEKLHRYTCLVAAAAAAATFTTNATQYITLHWHRHPSLSAPYAGHRVQQSVIRYDWRTAVWLQRG